MGAMAKTYENDRRMSLPRKLMIAATVVFSVVFLKLMFTPPPDYWEHRSPNAPALEEKPWGEQVGEELGGVYSNLKESGKGLAEGFKSTAE